MITVTENMSPLKKAFALAVKPLSIALTHAFLCFPTFAMILGINSFIVVPPLWGAMMAVGAGLAGVKISQTLHKKFNKQAACHTETHAKKPWKPYAFWAGLSLSLYIVMHGSHIINGHDKTPQGENAMPVFEVPWCRTPA